MRIRDYDIIVIGAGHAGCEAALAAARMGLQTAVITMRLDTIAQMPCNPAIGGLAKGHLVKEIDALGGEMARNTDRSSIQFRMLNTKKGPAVWGPRAQCDKKRYSHAMRTVLETQPNLTVIQDSVEDILTENGTVAGVRILSGAVITAHAVIVTTGTFLKGLIHVGDHNYEAGRYGEPPAKTLSDSLRALGYKLGRLKTGTPPRIKRDSINFDATAVQPPDDVYQSFSRAIKQPMLPQVNCWITYTTDATKKAIMDNIHRSPLYAGKISGIGPRYCPSIEDKIVKFPHKEKHQIFIEPEG
ncbi:tRNA uridine-5-carboxymethylaminomethyl(34) synthesis enzyme MnmG, partial [bacterium]|nr:tRNA uridine-5-carboxymethylaminomethyl(34) synthesis enzyme MnmG [bacterium]